MGNPFVEASWVPQGWLPKDFYQARWELDTEMVLGAWVFYRFARQYWDKHRY